MHRNVLNPEQLARRVEMAVAEYLFRRLVVPKVYLEAPWPRRNRVDVLAVDRAGTGDVHVVEVKVGTRDLPSAVENLKNVPAHYKYLALMGNQNYIPAYRSLFSPEGIGRIGILQIQELPNRELSVSALIRPERFRAEPSLSRTVDKFTASHPADLEIRE